MFSILFYLYTGPPDQKVYQIIVGGASALKDVWDYSQQAI
jgi:hypothetical protein